jgi:hypothetical protein
VLQQVFDVVAEAGLSDQVHLSTSPVQALAVAMVQEYKCPWQYWLMNWQLLVGTSSVLLGHLSVMVTTWTWPQAAMKQLLRSIIMHL